MAKITAEFDTVAKTLTCSVGGASVSDVEEIYMTRGYSDESKYGCSLSTVKRDKDEGITHVTRLIAAVSEDGSVEFVPNPSSGEAVKVRTDIENYLSRE